MKKHREEKYEDDCFKKLPDDVIFDILSRVSDSSKFLIQCLLLSKQIASVIRHVSSISIKIDLSFSGRENGYCYNLVSLRCKFINPNYSQGDDDEFKNCWKLNRWLFSFEELAHLYIDRAREELHQFSNIKSAIVDYPRYQMTYHDTKMMKWMMEYSSNPGIVKSCAVLGLIDDKQCREITTLGFYGVSDMNIYTWVASLFQTGFTLYPMVARMAQDHESLRDVLVTAGSRKGWIHAGEDEIVKMRRTGGSADELVKMAIQMMMDVEIIMMVKAWYVTVPVTMTESSVYVFALFSSPDNIDREVKAATRKFWGECSYWAGHDDDEKINMTEWVETMPCDLEFIWIANFEPSK